MTLLDAGKKISRKYFLILTILLLVLLAMAAGELVYGIFSKSDPGFLYEFTKELGGIGSIFAFVALLLFPLRRGGKALRQKISFFSSRFFTVLSAFIALIHPLLGLCAFVCLFTHGFIFLKVVYSFNFTLLNAMGATALTFLTVLLVSGTLLKNRLSSTQIRRTHMTAALLFITFYILHKAMM